MEARFGIVHAKIFLFFKFCFFSFGKVFNRIISGLLMRLEKQMKVACFLDQNGLATSKLYANDYSIYLMERNIKEIMPQYVSLKDALDRASRGYSTANYMIRRADVLVSLLDKTESLEDKLARMNLKTPMFRIKELVGNPPLAGNAFGFLTGYLLARGN